MKGSTKYFKFWLTISIFFIFGFLVKSERNINSEIKIFKEEELSLNTKLNDKLDVIIKNKRKLSKKIDSINDKSILLLEEVYTYKIDKSILKKKD